MPEDNPADLFDPAKLERQLRRSAGLVGLRVNHLMQRVLPQTLQVSDVIANTNDLDVLAAPHDVYTQTIENLHEVIFDINEAITAELAFQSAHKRKGGSL